MTSPVKDRHEIMMLCLLLYGGGLFYIVAVHAFDIVIAVIKARQIRPILRLIQSLSYQSNTNYHLNKENAKFAKEIAKYGMYRYNKPRLTIVVGRGFLLPIVVKFAESTLLSSEAATRACFGLALLLLYLSL